MFFSHEEKPLTLLTRICFHVPGSTLYNTTRGTPRDPPETPPRHPAVEESRGGGRGGRLPFQSSRLAARCRGSTTRTPAYAQGAQRLPRPRLQPNALMAVRGYRPPQPQAECGAPFRVKSKAKQPSAMGGAEVSALPQIGQHYGGCGPISVLRNRSRLRGAFRDRICSREEEEEVKPSSSNPRLSSESGSLGCSLTARMVAALQTRVRPARPAAR